MEKHESELTLQTMTTIWIFRVLLKFTKRAYVKRAKKCIKAYAENSGYCSTRARTLTY